MKQGLHGQVEAANMEPNIKFTVPTYPPGPVSKETGMGYPAVVFSAPSFGMEIRVGCPCLLEFGMENEMV